MRHDSPRQMPPLYFAGASAADCILAPSGEYRIVNFYAPQLYRQVLLRRVLVMGILSVRLSVTTRWYTKPR